MKTYDRDIRIALHDTLPLFYNQDPDTLVIDELNLCQGEARIDVAVVNGKMHGFEIKSDSDTLERLPRQVLVYSRVFDTVSIVTGQTSLDSITSLVPEWWGISLAFIKDSDVVCIEKIREPQQNPSPDSFSLAQFLWKEEILDFLEQQGFSRKETKKASCFKLWNILSDTFTSEEIRKYVSLCFKNRANWRADAQHKLCDDSC